MRRLLLPFVAVLALALPAPSLAATITVKIAATGFTPKTVTVNQGDTVKWTNADKVNHQTRREQRRVCVGDHQARRDIHVHVQHGRDVPLPRRAASVADRTITVKGPPPSVTRRRQRADHHLR